MRVLYVLFVSCLFLGATRADDSHEDDDCDCDRGPGLLRSRADNNDVSIGSLRRRAEALEKTIHDIRGAEDIDKLTNRVDAVLGDDCDHDTQYHCNHGKCISKLLVCDKHPDCGEEDDEDHTEFGICHNPVPEGSSWGGHAYWNSCAQGSRVGEVKLIITNFNPSSSFGAHVPVDGTTFIYDMDGSYTTSFAIGHYDYGTRTLSLRNQGGHGIVQVLTMECHFQKGDNDRCVGGVFRDGQKDACAEIIFERD